MKKPVVVFVGLDHVGKSSLAQMLAKRLSYQFDNFPSSRFPFLRQIGKSLECVLDSQTISENKFKTSKQSQCLAHTLSHSLSYDRINHLLKKHTTKGVVIDRFWYCAYAYNSAIGGVDVDFLMRIENGFVRPIVPDLVVYVKSDVVFGKLDSLKKSDREDPQYRNAIHAAYLRVLSSEAVTKNNVMVIHFINSSKQSLEDNFERLFDLVKEYL